MIEGSVIIRETTWRLDEKKRQLTDRFRVLRFHPIGRCVPGSNAQIVPLSWEKQLANGDWHPVSSHVMVGELNRILAFILKTLRAA